MYGAISRDADQRDADTLHAFMHGQVHAYLRGTAPPPRHTTRTLAAQIGWRETRLKCALDTLTDQARVKLNPHDGTWCAL